jgi:predicted metal-binding protein
MDRETAEAARGNVPSTPVVISVCITCKTADGAAVAGPDMLESVKAAIGLSDHVRVRPVQCLSVCKRPATVAVTSADGYTFLFGDLQIESGTAALVSFVQSYQNSDYGLVPWRERADVLRKGMVARVPPMRWSPDDGSAPK